MVTDLLNLQDYITSNVGVNCFIGDSNVSQSDYIRIMPTPLTFDVFNKKVVGTNFPVDLEIIVDRDNTIGGYEILERLIKKINSFSYESGDELQDEATPEYDENNFTIRVGFNLKTIIQEA